MRCSVNRRNGIVRTAGAVLLFGLGCALFLTESVTETAFSQARRTRRNTTTRRAAPTRPEPRYSQFPHDVQAHKKECASCHKFPSANWKTVRAEKDAFPDVTEYPQHASCLGCHRPQFFRGSKPAICSICHVNPSPRDSRRHPFPNPREVFDTSAKGKRAVSDFEIRFPHATHIDIVSQLNSTVLRFRNASFGKPILAEESCAVCHKTLNPQGQGSDEYYTKPPAKLGDGYWLKKGTFKSVPTGHTTCFTCHSADSGLSPGPDSCASCHSLKQKPPVPDFDAKLATQVAVPDKVSLDAWRRRDSSGTFRHEFSSHADMECATCHTVDKMNTLDPATKKVPIAACSMCHVTATIDDGGALNYEADQRVKNPAFQCVKCHITYGRLPLPASHSAALSAAK